MSADILLVEGICVSVWPSNIDAVNMVACRAYTGALDDTDDPNSLIEADTIHGVTTVPLSKYAGQHTRICRPVGLTEEDTKKLLHL